MKFGGHGIDKEVYDYIRFTLPEGKKILELGSGECSTKNLSEHYTMFSVEHDDNFLCEYKSTYIYIPLESGWYDSSFFHLLPKDYDLLLVDGPVDETHRKDFCGYYHLFRKDVPWVFHDLDRPSEVDILRLLSGVTGRKSITYKEYPFFGILLPI